MDIKHIKFEKSSAVYSECPKTNKPEYAFIGRSNVGKSSLINMLSNNKNLAKISSRPGKTQLINHFYVDESWYLVDLPGYGYARTGKKNRLKFAQFTEEYLLKRKNLSCVFSLVDARLEPQKNDLDFMEFLATNGIPFVLVFTKIDKLGMNKLKENLANYRAKLSNVWEELPLLFYSSSVKKIGREEILNFIDNTNEIYWQTHK